MYRLLNTKNSFLYKLPIVSNENYLFKVNSNRLWAQKLSCIDCIRNQSTSTDSSLVENMRKKKRKRPFKPYSDLLVVTGTAAKQRKAPITKLTWKHLKILSDTNVSLTELYKLKDLASKNQNVKEHSYNNLNIIDVVLQNEGDNVQKLQLEESKLQDITEEVAENTVVSTDEELLEKLPVMDALQPEIVEEEEVVEKVVKLKKTDSKKSTEKSKSEIVSTHTLGAYLEMCSVLKNPNRGLNALLFHIHRAEKGGNNVFQPIKQVRVYNALLKGFASKGDIGKLEEILTIINNEGVKLNIQSYLAIFECYGRNNFDDHYLKQIRIYAKNAAQNGLTFDALLSYGKFLNDEREVVLKAMQSCYKGYIPKYFKPKVQYENHLVNKLNDPEQLLPIDDVTPAKKNSGLFTEETMKMAIKQQLKLEKEGTLLIKNINNEEVTDEVLKYRKVLAEHYKNWEEAATKAFIRDLSALTAQRSPLSDEPFMRSIPVKDFVTIIIDEAKQLSEGSETFSPLMSSLCRQIGKKVYKRYLVLRKQKTGTLDKLVSVHTKYCTLYANEHQELDVLPFNCNLTNSRQKFQWLEHSEKSAGASLLMEHSKWVPPTMYTIGKFLYRIILHDLKIDVNAMRKTSTKPNYLPAFYSIYRPRVREAVEEVKPHPVLSRLHKASMPEYLTFPTNELPMFCPPVPWTSVDNGGYLATSSDLARIPLISGIQRTLLTESGSQLYPAFDSLNQLAAVPWKVNTKVFDIILEVFKKGGSNELNVPINPSSVPPLEKPQNIDKDQKYNYYKEKMNHQRKLGELYSMWCDCLYRLSLGDHYRDKIFWLPHNMDFRGRAYPIPPHLNHLGSDLARSMLIFADGRPLGKDGLTWLKLHLINLTGLKKRDPIAERIAYADEVMNDILDSADNPLNGKKWWAQSEEPWQTLACCDEIAKAIRSGNPETFRSHFPVHQDGSCNGLQHYAALGRDSAGAYSVNLTPSSVPQDVYSAVVALVEERRKNDALNGLEVAQALEGFVKRKVIKQTIMTTVYGVTKYGAKLQIAKQLKDIDDFPQNMVFAASAYLTGCTFDSLSKMFLSSRKIQDWFTDCAKLISTSGHQVQWITPLGLPIAQPYIVPKVMELRNSLVYKSFRTNQFEKPNVMKQKNAFAPNFIHSLDATHMMLTSLHCERVGITFVSVHDCYWTHPSTAAIMNKICREQFVVLHSEPILENLYNSFVFKYTLNHKLAQIGASSKPNKPTQTFSKPPKTGDFDIEQVTRSTYFFS